MEKEIDEIEFANGFNKAYWLYNYEPEVAKSLIKAEINERDDFSSGFSAGLKQAEQEKTIKEFERLRNKTSEQDRSIEH